MIHLPTGSIVLWAGAIVDIPASYALCDGNNGTPDLRDRFVVGAGSTYAVDASGGASNHTHNFTGDGHYHALLAGTTLQAGSGYSANTTVVAVTGTTDSENHLPPYYALAYIMKT